MPPGLRSMARICGSHGGWPPAPPGSGFERESPQNGRHVVFDGFIGEAQGLADFLVGVASQQQVQHVLLARRELRRRAQRLGLVTEHGCRCVHQFRRDVDLARQHQACDREQFVTHAGLGEKSGGPLVQDLMHDARGGRAGEHDDGQFGVLSCEPVQRLQASHVWQVVVQQHEIEVGMHRGQLEGSAARAGF